MKRTICILLSIGIMLLSACAPRATVDEVPSEAEQAVPTETVLLTDASTSSEPTPTVMPTATIAPTPTPEPQDGEKYDVKRERVRCRVDILQLDMKETWKVNSPTESPDPAWVIESVEGDTVTYSKTDCGHVKRTTLYIQCQLIPNSSNTDTMEQINMLESDAYDFDTHDGYWTLISNEDGIVTYASPQLCQEYHDESNEFEYVPCRRPNANEGDNDVKYIVRVLATSDNKPDAEDGWELVSTENGIETYWQTICRH